MNNSKLMIGILLVSAQLSYGQTKEFTLEEAKSYAIENQVIIKNAQHDITDAKERANEIRGIGLPQVNLTGQFGNFLNLPVQVIDESFFNPGAPDGALVSFRAGTDYNSSANLQATQILFNGSYIIGLQAAKNYASFQETKAELTKEDVVYNVVQAYQLAAVAKTNLSFVDSITSLTEEMVNKQSVFFDLGLMKSEDMDQLNYSLLTAKQSQMAANLQYQNALTLLKYSMGYPVDEQISIAQSVDALISKKTIGPRNIKSNLSYELIKKQIRLSELDLKNKQFSNLPNLNAYYQQSYTAYRNEFNFFDADKQWFLQSSWGLQLNIPVFSGGQRHALTQQAKIRLMKDQNSLMQMEQTLKMQETQAKNNLLNAQSKLELQKQNVVLARKIYQNATASEQIGEGTSIVVTQKYNQLIVAQTQYVGATIDLFQAQLELDKIYNTILKN